MPGIQSLSPVSSQPLQKVLASATQASVSDKKSAALLSQMQPQLQMQPDSESPESGREFDESCARELTKTHGAAQGACKARLDFAKVLLNEAGPKIPTGKSEARAAAEIDQAKAMREVADANWSHSLAALTAVTAHRPADELLRNLDNEVNALPEEAHRALASAGIMRSPLPSAAPGADDGHTPGSYGDFWDKLSTAVGGLKTDYLGTYEKAVEKNNAFYRDFTKFVSDSVKWTKGSTDITLTLDDVESPVTDAEVNAEYKKRYPNDNAEAIINMGSGVNLPTLDAIKKAVGDAKDAIRAELELDRPKVRTGFLVALREIMQKYQPFRGHDEGVLVSIEVDLADGDDAEAIAEAKAKKWASDMGLPETSVRRNPLPPDEWWVTVDLTPVQAMIDQLKALAPDGSKTVTLTPARNTSYQSGAEAQKEQLKATASTLGQKMAGAQSIYENLIKVLTSTISAMLDTAKSFLMN